MSWTGVAAWRLEHGWPRMNVSRGYRTRLAEKGRKDETLAMGAEGNPANMAEPISTIVMLLLLLQLARATAP